MLKKENIDDQRLASSAFQGSNLIKSDKSNEDFPNNFNGAGILMHNASLFE